MSVIVFDRHGNFSGLGDVQGQEWLILRASELRLALLEAVTEGFVRQVIMLLGEVLGLIKSLNVIFDAYTEVAGALAGIPNVPSTPTLSQIIEALKHLPFRDTKRDYVLSALTELNGLNRACHSIWDWSESRAMPQLTAPGAHTVIQTTELDLKGELVLLVWMLLYCIASGRQQPRPYQVYFIIDELQHLFQKQWGDSNMLRTLKNTVLTARQPRVCIIGGAQLPASLEPELLASASTIICTGLQDSDNIRAVGAGAMGLPHGPAHGLFQSLGIGEAVYNFADRPGPFKIDIPFANVPATCDEATRQKEVRQFQQSCNVRPGAPWDEVLAAIQRKQKTSPSKPDASELALLKAAADTYASPLPLSNLASRAGLPGPEGSRASKSLEKRGLAHREPVLIGRTRMVFAEPTDEGFKVVNMTPPTGVGRGGAGHRYCLGQAEKKLQGMGYMTQREVELGGKRIDLVGRKSSSRVFVEVEMSDKNAARNAAADHAVADASVKQILVLCPSARVLKPVQKAVQSALDARALKRFAFKTVSDL